MKRLSWPEFLIAGYPAEAAAAEADKGVLFRIHRWLGLRLAYPLYRLGLSANTVSLLRLVMGITGVCLLLAVMQDAVVFSFLGASLVYGQVLLDFSDGAIARVQAQRGVLGNEFDIMGCDASRVAMIVLIGIYNDSAVAVLLAAFCAYVLTIFRLLVDQAVAETAFNHLIRSLSRRLLSDQILLVVLPFILASLTLFNLPLLLVARALLGIYIALSAAWLVVPSRC